MDDPTILDEQFLAQAHAQARAELEVALATNTHLWVTEIVYSINPGAAGLFAAGADRVRDVYAGCRLCGQAVGTPMDNASICIPDPGFLDRLTE